MWIEQDWVADPGLTYLEIRDLMKIFLNYIYLLSLEVFSKYTNWYKEVNLFSCTKDTDKFTCMWDAINASSLLLKIKNSRSETKKTLFLSLWTLAQR